MAYNPYEEFRRRQQLQGDPQPVSFAQPAPVQMIPPSPEMTPPQWQPMGDQGQSQNAGAAGAGMASLLKRFRKPVGATPGDAKQAWEQGGSL